MSGGNCQPRQLWNQHPLPDHRRFPLQIGDDLVDHCEHRVSFGGMLFILLAACKMHFSLSVTVVAIDDLLQSHGPGTIALVPVQEVFDLTPRIVCLLTPL